MRKLCVCLIFLGLAGGAAADVSVSIFEADGIAPFDNRGILPDTYLTLLIQSDQSVSWGGGLVLQDDSLLLGEIIARGPLSKASWTGSILTAAGTSAVVYDWQEEGYAGYTINTGKTPVAGDWFVFDYHALGEGNVSIMLYDNDDWENPVEYAIHQIPEPASLLLLSTGFLAIRRRRKSLA